MDLALRGNNWKGRFVTAGYQARWAQTSESIKCRSQCVHLRKGENKIRKSLSATPPRQIKYLQDTNCSKTLATWCKELTHWKRLRCWERLRAGGKGDDRGWDGWMASLTQWTWVWADSGKWWRTGKPGMPQSVGSQIIFNFFLIYVFLTAVGLCGAQALHCCMWAFSSCRGFSLVVVHGLLLWKSMGSKAWASVVVAHGLSGSRACGSLVPKPGIKAMSPALTTGQPSWILFSLNLCSNNHMGLEVVILDTSPRTCNTKISGENWNIYEDSGRNWVSLFWWILLLSG